MCLLIGDIYVMGGISLNTVQIHDRINHCIDIMENKYITDSFKTSAQLLSNDFDFNQIRSIFSDFFIPKLPYRIRGFYFVPLKTSYSKILYLFKHLIIKSKLTNKKYISFRIIQTVKPRHL